MKRLFLFLTCAALCGASLVSLAENAEFAAGSRAFDGAEVSSVRIDVRDREIVVSRSEDEQVRIDYFESDKEYYNISLSEDGALEMIAVSDKAWTDYFGLKPAKELRVIHLWLPDALLEALEISTTNADISVSEIGTVGAISLTSNGGDIRFSELSVAESLELSAKNADIEGTILGGYDDFSMACRVKKGECNLPEAKEDGEKRLSVSVNNGDAEIRFVG